MLGTYITLYKPGSVTSFLQHSPPVECCSDLSGLPAPPPSSGDLVGSQDVEAVAAAARCHWLANVDRRGKLKYRSRSALLLLQFPVAIRGEAVTRSVPASPTQRGRGPCYCAGHNQEAAGSYDRCVVHHWSQWSHCHSCDVADVSTRDCDWLQPLPGPAGTESIRELSSSRTADSLFEDLRYRRAEVYFLFHVHCSQGMSTAILVTFVKHGGSQVRRGALLTSRVLQDNNRVALACQCSTTNRRSFSSRFDPDGSGRPATWDSFGIWDNRLDEPIQLPPSIKYGKLIPRINLSKVGCSTQLGKRKENEDRFNFAKLTDDVLCFAVYDGHGGAGAADFCDRFMTKYIKEFLAQEQDMEKVLTKAFLEIDKAFAREAHLSVDATLMNCGTTATVALLREGIELVVASVGDSRALLCRRGKPMKLTIDHTPERKEEKQRIRECGGFVAWNSLGQPHVNGRLAMTRSIGDLDLKTMGVIAEPETKRVKLHHAEDSFLVLTTDGINFIVNSQEICDIINQCNDPREAAQVLTEQVIQYGAEDNSTAIIVPFGAWGKHKSSEISFSFSRGFASSGRWA